MEKIKKILLKLNLFDKVLIFGAIVFVAFFASVFFRKSTYVTVVIKVGEESTRYEAWMVGMGTKTWFSQMFYEGMKETDGLGDVKAEVLSIYSYDTLPSRRAVYLTLKLKAVYNRASNQYTFKGLPILIGSTIKLNLDSLYVEGLVTNLEGVKDIREKVTLKVDAQVREETPVYPDTSGAKDYIANVLEVGDEVKDGQGNTILKILGKRVENAKRLVTTSDGRALVQTNPLRRDIYLTLEINTVKIGDRYFLFDDIPLLIGEKIPINTETTSLWPEVTKIYLP